MIERATGQDRAPDAFQSSVGARLNDPARSYGQVVLPTWGHAALPWAIPFTLFGLGLALRLPHLWTIPTLTDEVNEVLRGLAVAEGRLLPLTNVNTYLGSFYNYLLAAVFLVIGRASTRPGF